MQVKNEWRRTVCGSGLGELLRKYDPRLLREPLLLLCLLQLFVCVRTARERRRGRDGEVEAEEEAVTHSPERRGGCNPVSFRGKLPLFTA